VTVARPQLPDPVHVAAADAWLASMHAAAAHEVVPSGNCVQRMRSEPPQVPAHTPVPHAGRAPAGGVPFGVAVQKPFQGASAHCSHCELHAVSQQTPSTQNPLAQSAATAHGAPRSYSSEVDVAKPPNA
jgi:hypothetical protein